MTSCVHVRRARVQWTHLDLNGVVQNLTSQCFYSPGEGCTEQDCLTVWPRVVNDASDLCATYTHTCSQYTTSAEQGSNSKTLKSCSGRHVDGAWAGLLQVAGWSKHPCRFALVGVSETAETAVSYVLKSIQRSAACKFLHSQQFANANHPNAVLHTCGSNPMSNMRSASSKTRYVTRRRLVTLLTKRSMRRPGVAATTCRNSQTQRQARGD